MTAIAAIESVLHGTSGQVITKPPTKVARVKAVALGVSG